jgi:hypothetical protein
MRRRKPWVLCRRRLFGWNVRLLNVLTPLRGFDSTVSVTGSCRARGSPVAGQLAPLAHARPNCHGHAAPVDAGETCLRYAWPRDRVNSNEGVPSRAEPGTLTLGGTGFSTDTPPLWGYRGLYLWTTVDPQGRELLASMLRTAPPRPIGLSVAISRSILWSRPGASTSHQWDKAEQTGSCSQHGEFGESPNRDILRYCTTCGQRCGRSRDPRGPHLGTVI